MQKEKKVLQKIAQTIFDKKGMNILTLDMRSCQKICDFVVVAEGLANTHVRAIADAVLHIAQKEKMDICCTEGMKNGDWVVIDFFGIMVHIFTPGMRDKYALEELWSDAEIVDIPIQIAAYSMENGDQVACC